ncbi:GspE/PulE family protein [Rhodoferax sp.]|uniref:GspE/PulE family protein n=1 Tax=Rhodoferax sp. TaxID=50421 RepID=UPI0027756E45|nr:GspE/PulE family protein [Rhodoferax sp.]
MTEISYRLIGQQLLNQGALDEPSLASALALQQRTPQERLGAILVRLGLVSEQTLLAALAGQLGVGLLADPELSNVQPLIAQWHAANQVPQAMATRLQFLAWQGDDTATVHVAARDVLGSELREFLEAGPARGLAPSYALIATRDLERVLAQIYRSVGHAVDGYQDLRRLAEDAPVVELVNGLLARATDTRASDVHVEPQELGFTVRYRIDGVLQNSEKYPRERFDAVVSRIKLIAGLDIAERRLPQDGRFSSRMAGIETDVRVSVIPGVHGESLVLRLLPNTQATRFDLNNIGIEPDHLALYKSWMAHPDGIVLVTGPTGSGKSTTLYATLVATDTEHDRVLTVEDPVEYRIPGVTQFQVHPDIGFTFPAALRSILRHDPDTIMIGEIRDVETARIAVQASLTGHRVFSTLHTNDCATAFLRLADMGVEPFLVGATVRGVVAQRLVRVLCEACAVPVTDLAKIPAAVMRELSEMGQSTEGFRFREPKGCPHCSGTGYRGRTAIYELMPATDALRAVLNQPNPSLGALMATVGKGYRNLRQDGLIKAACGVTSLAEILTIAGAKYVE